MKVSKGREMGIFVRVSIININFKKVTNMWGIDRKGGAVVCVCVVGTGVTKVTPLNFAIYLNCSKN